MKLEQDINKIIENMQLAEPIYISLNTHSGLSLKYAPRAQSKLEEIVWQYSNIFFNKKTKEFELEPSENIVEHTKKHIKSNILKWINNCTWSPNPKLTANYRWYHSQDEITDAMYILWKYMASECSAGFYDNMRSQNKHYNNVSCLIEWIRLRGG